MSKVLVIQYEQFFGLDEGYNGIPEAVREGLDILRSYGGARVINSYETEDNAKFLDKAITSIIINSPVTLKID